MPTPEARQILALADDLTGALEAGAKLAAPVYFAASRLEAGALVIDTETRHLSPICAATKVTNLVSACGDYRLKYKKTDSTLRGNIGAELRALSCLDPEARIAYVPAYPALGRTVFGGRLYVNGLPIEDSPFARDPLHPIRDGRIAAVLNPDLPCTVFDGQSDGDIVGAAGAILSDPRFRIIAGPAAIAGALAQELGIQRPGYAREKEFETCWIINGSLHEMSWRQIDFVARADRLPQGWTVISPPVSVHARPPQVAADAAQYVCELFSQRPPQALIVFGGDTAFAIVRALRCPALRVLGEVLPGVPISEMEGYTTLLITKAGGYGDVNLLSRLRQALYGNNE